MEDIVAVQWSQFPKMIGKWELSASLLKIEVFTALLLNPFENYTRSRG